jgi:putative ABC transport system substrate-binding protein
MGDLPHWRRLTARGTLAAALCAALACAAPAQAQRGKVYRVAFIATTSPLSVLTGSDPVNPAIRAFVHRLRDLGYVDGRNLVLDVRTLEGRPERIEEVVADVVRLKPDVIFASSQNIVERSLKLTADVPIVMLAAGAVVETGLVQSLARPGGTITGLLVDVDVGVEAKRLEMLREIMPKVRRVAYLGPQIAWGSAWLNHVSAAAQRLGLDFFNAGYKGGDFDGAAALLARDRPEAVFVPTGPSSYAHREQIGRFVVANRIACVSAHSEIAEHGCLMSYGVNTNDLLRRAAGYVAKILEGAKPGDLPIEQPTTFELVINAKTAKALGLTIPQSILLRADRVIE